MPLLSVRECIFAPFEVEFLAEFALEFDKFLLEFAAKFTKFCEFLLKFAEFAAKFKFKFAEFKFKFAAFNNDGKAATAPSAAVNLAEFAKNSRLFCIICPFL